MIDESRCDTPRLSLSGRRCTATEYHCECSCACRTKSKRKPAYAMKKKTETPTNHDDRDAERLPSLHMARRHLIGATEVFSLP